MKKIFPYLISITFCFQIALISVRAQKMEFTPNCANSYTYFLSFRIKEAKAELAKEIQQNKANWVPYFLINYDEFITLSFNENPDQYKKSKSLLKTRLQLLEKCDDKSPYKLFFKGLLYFQWSIIEAKHTDFMEAAWDFRRSYIAFKENQENFPKFQPNQIYLGMQEALISSIPKGYKWVGNILGLKGNLTTGMRRLKTYIDSGNQPFKEEAITFYIYLKNYLENDPKEALELISQYKLDTKNNMLYVFMAANLALNNKNAMMTEKILTERNKGSNYFNFPMLDYEMGDAKLKKLDYSAIPYFQSFLNSYKGYFYIKDAHYQMALAYHLQGDRSKALFQIEQVIKKGYTETDADKQALKQAKLKYLPNRELLKARLLNDGGYNNESLKLLESLTADKLITPAEKLEFSYRLARVHDDLNHDELALQYYKQTLTNGMTSTEYFAARSALQMAFIYEKRKQIELARQFYNQVLDLEDHDYKNSLDQRAKSGLNRLGK